MVFQILTAIFGATTLIVLVGGKLIQWGIQMGRDQIRLQNLEEHRKIHYRIDDLEEVVEQMRGRPFVSRYPEHRRATRVVESIAHEP